MALAQRFKFVNKIKELTIFVLDLHAKPEYNNV